MSFGSNYLHYLTSNRQLLAEFDETVQKLQTLEPAQLNAEQVLAATGVERSFAMPYEVLRRNSVHHHH
jgi:hypothetical protein